MSAFVWLLLLCAAAGVVYLVVSVRRRRQVERSQVPKSPEELATEQALRVDRQAQKELAEGNLEAARTLFIEARRPGKAAQVAVREGRLDLAGALFEKDGRPDKALVAYRKAGLANQDAAKEPEQALLAVQVSASPRRSVSSRAPRSAVSEITTLPQSDPFAGAPIAADDWAQLPADDSDAWLLEDGLLELPGAPPSVRPVQVAPAPAEANQSAASRVALGVIALIKPRRARAVVEETVAVTRQHNDDR